MYGSKATLPTALSKTPGITYSYEDYAQELKEKLRAANKIARENLREEKTKAKDYYDKKTKETTHKVGDKILLHDETLRRGRSKKLESPWIGPYVILEKHDNVNYTIKMGRRKLRVHVNRIKPFVDQ